MCVCVCVCVHVCTLAVDVVSGPSVVMLQRWAVSHVYDKSVNTGPVSIAVPIVYQGQLTKKHAVSVGVAGPPLLTAARETARGGN